MECLAKWKNKRILVQAAMIVTGILFIIIGYFRQEISTVLMKAIYICLECIGIG